MGLLRRRSEGHGVARDDHLTFLTVAQADLIRRLIREAFAEHGREVVDFADQVRDDAGAQFGLWNVAVACRNESRGESAWPGVVAEHVRRVLAGMDRDVFEGLNLSDVRSRTYARLMPADGVPDLSWFSYARELAPGLLEVLAFDLPDSVVTFRDQDVERFGGVAALREAGLGNLRALAVEEQEQIVTPDGGHFDVLLGESVYTASRVLVMPDLLVQMLGSVNPAYGVLAAMANRHQAALHVINDQSVIPSINHMARFAPAGFSDGAGCLSPNLYWWRDGMWQQVSRVDASGKITVMVGTELGHVLEQLPNQ
jgi:hypothetical protein